MKILITGGAGFIGSNLVDYFLSKNHEVVCLDDLSTGFRKNIKHNFDNPNFTFIEGDIRDMQTYNHTTMQLLNHPIIHYSINPFIQSKFIVKVKNN